MIEKRKPAYPALLLTQNKHRFYFCTIVVDDLLEHCFVARREEEDAQQELQRALSEGRADDISRYLSSGNGSIPTNVVLSAQDEADLQYNARSKQLAF
jgi:hypothetical protein